MLYFITYMAYVVLTLFVFSLNNVSLTNTASDLVAGIVISIQLVAFVFMFIMRRKEYDFKQVKSFVLEEADLPISQRKTNVTFANWSFLLLVYLSSQYLGGHLPSWAFINSSIQIIILFFITIYPLIVESNYAYKKIDWKAKVLLPIGLYFVYLFATGAYMEILRLTGLTPEASETVNQSIVVAMIGMAPIKMFFSVAILAPILEEIIFRGLGFRTLIHRNKFLAYISTFLLFALIHIMTGLGEADLVSELILSVPYGINGLVLAFAYFKTGSIYSSMTIHALSNTIAFALILSGVAT